MPYWGPCSGHIIIMSIDIERQSQICTWVKNWIRTRLDRARCFEPSLRGLRGLLWVADCTTGGMVGFAQTRHDTSDGAGRVAVGEFRHGVPTRAEARVARISNCKRRCDARGEFPGASGSVPRHGLLRNFESEFSSLSRPPTPPPPSIYLLRAVAWHRNGAAHWDHPPPHHHQPSHCSAGWSCWSLEPPPTPPPQVERLSQCLASWHVGIQPCPDAHGKKQAPDKRTSK